MQPLAIHFTSAPSPSEMIRLVDQAIAQGAQGLLLLAADGNQYDPAEIDSWLRALPVPVCGGVFPQLIHDQKNHEQGVIVAGFSQPIEVHEIAGLSTPDADYFEAVEACFDPDEVPASLLVFVDGMASRIGDLLDGVYDVLGSDPVYAGGGAGSLSFQQKPCIFSNRGMLADHAQLVSLPWALNLGVDHGWEKFAGPFVVTRASRNEIDGLDFRPAFDVYREHVEADSARRFTSDNFFDIAKGYPFGMEKPDGSIVVRDPITHDADKMVCVGEVPPHSVLYLLKGRPERLIEAARSCATRLPPGSAPTLITDCISRVLFLEQDFTRELEAVQQALGDRPLFGVLSLGEIANGGTHCLEFYNKTLVLAALAAD